MRMLALETSGTTGSLAVLRAGRVLWRSELPPASRTAQSLVPAIQAALREVAWKPAELEWIAVTQGPGSFTGLRVGITVAKTLAYATGARVMGLNSLAVIAERAAVEGELWVVMDAQRRQVFAARFQVGPDDCWSEAEATRILDDDQWLTALRPGHRVSGPVLKRLASRLAVGVVPEHETCWLPDAADVGRLAWRTRSDRPAEGHWTLHPKYFRRSAAEEKHDG